jgi:hydrogenase expression/formation protein HypC
MVCTPNRSIRPTSEKGERDVCLAIPGQIVSFVDESVGLASVEIAGVRRTVSVGLLDAAVPGDWVLVHVGFAIARVDEEEAHATLALLREMGAEYETELEELKASAIE